MPWDALRPEVALPAIARVLEGAPAEREVDRALRAHRGLTRDERAAVVEAIFGVALWRRRLAWHAGTDIPAILLASLLHDLAGVPADRAASLAGAGGPGRGPGKKIFFFDDPAATPTRLADRWSLPDWLEAHLIDELGDEAEAFCAAIAVPGPVCLRANRLLCTREELASRLAEENIATRPGEKSPDALIVTRNANLFGSQAWRAGLFEPQDEGSQLVGQLVEARAGETVLDLCAGAGGKSLLLAAQGATVLAHDIDQGRLGRLRTRADRAGASSRIEIVKAPAPADRVLVDAPCSELGTLRRGPDARWLIPPEALHAHLRVQEDLLETAARCARSRIVYATCTLNRAENEDAALRFESAHREFRRAREFVRLLPHRDGTDGFFAVIWERA